MSLDVAERSPATAGGAKREQVLSFRLDNRLYGVPLAQVAEIQPFQPLTRMPRMPKGVEGLLDLRGQVIPVVNLRTRLALSPKDDFRGSIILVVEHAKIRTGLIVDGVEGVIREFQGNLSLPSRILEGLDGGWVKGFLVLEDRLVTLLDPARAARPAQHHNRASALADAGDVEARLDDDLQRLIAMAPGKADGKGRIIPQIEAAISHTEEEMAKVVERVEKMLAGTDLVFGGLARLKQEAALGHIKGEEPRIAELEKITNRIQEEVFQTLQACQFQDIARQKLERVLRHIQGMQGLIGKQFRDG